MNDDNPTARIKGAGTVYQRVSDGKWCGSIDLPRVNGKRTRKVFTAKTEAAVRAKLAPYVPDLPPVLTRVARNRAAAALSSYDLRDLMEKYRATVTCGYCGTHLNAFNKVKDHIVPVSRGGSNGLDNVQLICWECNVEKADSLTYVYPGTSPRPFRPFPRKASGYERFLAEGGDPSSNEMALEYVLAHFRIR